ncbi:DNA polymerase III PolC-type [uncultured archaeon]|nr:DNA polymerase III PolC-type [uncultured archaeon]
MIYCSIDFETTGTHLINDRGIESATVLFSTAHNRMLDVQSMLIKTDKPVTAEITGITGIIKAMLDRFGYENRDVLESIIATIEQSEAVIGYNSRRFDYHILDQWAKREGMTLPVRPWIDFFYDMPWQVPTGKLTHVMADHGFLNYFPHAALADALGVVLLSTKYSPELMLARSQSPVVVLRSQADRSQNDLVKKAKFRWNPGAKIWWKPVKAQDVQEVSESLPFGVSIDGRTQEELEGQ